MDRLFRTSNRPSNRGGLDLGLFRKSNRPSGRGGGWTLDFKKERIHYLGGKWYKQSDARMTGTYTLVRGMRAWSRAVWCGRARRGPGLGVGTGVAGR